MKCSFSIFKDNKIWVPALTIKAHVIIVISIKQRTTEKKFSDYVTNCKWKHTTSSNPLMPNLTFLYFLKTYENHTKVY